MSVEQLDRLESRDKILAMIRERVGRYGTERYQALCLSWHNLPGEIILVLKYRPTEEILRNPALYSHQAHAFDVIGRIYFADAPGGRTVEEAFSMAQREARRIYYDLRHHVPVKLVRDMAGPKWWT